MPTARMGVGGVGCHHRCIAVPCLRVRRPVIRFSAAEATISNLADLYLARLRELDVSWDPNSCLISLGCPPLMLRHNPALVRFVGAWVR